MGEPHEWKRSNNEVSKGASRIVNWVILEARDGDEYLVSPTSSSLSSSSDLDRDDAECRDYSNGPLYELSELLLQLPIKRGLSKYYQGKSQSFKNLGSVKNVNDIAKKASKGYATTPKPIICKKTASTSLRFLPSMAGR